MPWLLLPSLAAAFDRILLMSRVERVRAQPVALGAVAHAAAGAASGESRTVSAMARDPEDLPKPAEPRWPSQEPRGLLN